MRLTLIGEPLHVVDRLAVDGRLLPALSAAATGAIAFRTGAWSGRRHLTWFDRTGSEKGRVGTAHLALGDNHLAYPGGQNVCKLHLDGVILDASLEILDSGQYIVKDGEWAL